MDSRFTDEQIAALRGMVPDHDVSMLRVPRRPAVPYLETHVVIRAANEIFGFGRWGYVVPTVPYVAERGGTADRQYEVWACLVRLHVDGGEDIEEMGTNVRSGSGPDGLEMSMKGAISDGLKRCLKSYGDRFGLSLYDKHPEARAETRQDGPQPAESADPAAKQPSTAPEHDWTEHLRAEMADKGLRGVDLRRVIGGKAADAVHPTEIQRWLDGHPGRTIDQLVSDACTRRDSAAGGRR